MGRTLQGCDLSGTDLAEANLVAADLTQAKLSGANLQNARLTFARLDGASLAGADLTCALLRATTLIEANLTRAILVNTDLSDAVLRSAILVDADLFHAYLWMADLRKADLSRAILTHARLESALLKSKPPAKDAKPRSGLFAKQPESGVPDDACFRDARWDGKTRWPEGFDPEKQGTKLCETVAREVPHRRNQGAAAEVMALVRAQEQAQALAAGFNPRTIQDARDRVLMSVVLRRGQPQFRERLIGAYGARCAITGCDIVDVLEAAHIIPYRGGDTNCVANGLLLRADLHTLFDLGLLSIEPRTLTVIVHPRLRQTDYGELHGRTLRLPEVEEMHPSQEALRAHREWAVIHGGAGHQGWIRR
jgi:hypothetical protein